MDLVSPDKKGSTLASMHQAGAAGTRPALDHFIKPHIPAILDHPGREQSVFLWHQREIIPRDRATLSDCNLITITFISKRQTSFLVEGGAAII